VNYETGVLFMKRCVFSEFKYGKCVAALEKLATKALK